MPLEHPPQCGGRHFDRNRRRGHRRLSRLAHSVQDGDELGVGAADRLGVLQGTIEVVEAGQSDSEVPGRDQHLLAEPDPPEPLHPQQVTERLGDSGPAL